MVLVRMIRRFATSLALGLWLGGFTFYTAFVIPIGHRHVSSVRFGFITGEVTSLLNVLAVIALAVLLVNLITEWGGAGNVLRWGLAGTWVIAAVATVGLFLLHSKIDALLNFKLREIANREQFEVLHERYELIATAQWAAGLVHLWCVLAGWRKSDEARGLSSC